jgi:hypothetical protein
MQGETVKKTEGEIGQRNILLICWERMQGTFNTQKSLLKVLSTALTFWNIWS